VTIKRDLLPGLAEEIVMFEMRVLHPLPQKALFRSLWSPLSYAAFKTAIDNTLHFHADLHFAHVVPISAEFTEPGFFPEALKARNSVEARLTAFSQDSIWSLKRQASEDIGRTRP